MARGLGGELTAKATTPAGRRRASARAAAAAPRAKTAKPAPQRSASTATPRAQPASPRRAGKRAAARRPAAKTPGRAKARRSLPRIALPSRPRLGSLRRKAIVALVLVAALAIGYFAWFRDSSLVAVDDVTVEGLGGRGSNPATAALVAAGERMTTLHVDQGRLDGVAARFPEIASVSADASFPHGLTIHVAQRPPVMVARDGGHEVPVAGDGTLLSGDLSPDAANLPTVAVDKLPSSGTLSGTPRGEALVLGAAPAPLARQVRGIGSSASHGVTVSLRGGIQLRFGTPAAARAKWLAAAAVLADKRVTTLSYIDVQVPKRPALG